MARLCAFHAAVPASMSCGQCGAPLCAQCIHMVGVVPACAQCAPAIQTRQNQLSGVGAAAPRPAAQQSGNDPYPLRQLLYSQPAPVIVQDQALEAPTASHNTTIGGFLTSAFGSLFGGAGKPLKSDNTTKR